MSYSLAEHLAICTLKDLKDLVRKFNLENKIRLGQKKPELIADLLKHFGAELTAEKLIKAKPITLEMPKMDHQVKVEPKIKKERKVKVEMVAVVEPVAVAAPVAVAVVEKAKRVKKVKVVVPSEFPDSE